MTEAGGALGLGSGRIYSALVTPMLPNEAIDVQALRELVERQIARGVEGFYCCGSSGEGLLLDHAERTDVARVVVDQAGGRVPVIAHVGTIRSRDAAALARSAQDVGVSAVSLIPPYYYQWTHREVSGYYRAVADIVDIPVIVYNIPQFTGIEFDRDTARDLLRIDGVAGMKHTSHNMFTLERLRQSCPGKVLFNGLDEVYLAALAAGADATIGTTVNVQIELFRRVRSAFQRGDLGQAQRAQAHINDVVETLMAHGVFQSTKYLAGGDGLDLGACRAPFAALTEQDKRALDDLRGRITAFIDGSA